MKQLKQWSVGAAILLVAVIIASCGGKDERSWKGESKKSAKDSIKSSLLVRQRQFADKTSAESLLGLYDLQIPCHQQETEN